MKQRMRHSVAALVASAFVAAPAAASLTTFKTFVGNVGYSADGFGSTSQSGTISASVPVGATVLGAYLYTGMYDDTSSPAGTTLNGGAVSFGPNKVNTSFLSSARADVTSIVKPVIDAGPGGVYNFSVVESNSFQDGEALVVVYSHASLPEATVGILDGFAALSGDTTSINFANPLNPAAPGFFAEMALGINFSCCGQLSHVDVNGQALTRSAGNNDDGVGSISNGQLITVGGFDDPYSPANPTYDQDHERYNLVPFITAGDTSITVDTINPSNDDNIFLAMFHVSGRAGVNEPPPPPTNQVPVPGTLALVGLGLAALGARRRAAGSARG